MGVLKLDLLRFTNEVTSSSSVLYSYDACLISQSADEDLESTSSIFTMATFSTAGYRNPTFRVMYLDPVTYAPLEWDQYFIDINTAVGMYQYFNSVTFTSLE